MMKLVNKEYPKKVKSEQSDRKIGEILVEEGLINKDQLLEATQKQRSIHVYKPLGQILMEMKAVTRNQLEFALKRFDKRVQLGDVLVSSGAVTEEDVEIAIQYQKESGLRLGEALIKLNRTSEESMRQALCTQLNIPFVDLDAMNLDRSLSKIINKKYARKRQVIPISKIANILTLAMDDPTDTDVVNELQAFTGLTISVVTSTRSSILHAFVRLYEEYKLTKSVSTGIQFIEDKARDPAEISDYLAPQQTQRADALMSEIINVGLKHSASDIHLETIERRLIARFRVDGVLQDLHLGPMEEALNRFRREIISRIKIMGGLDITERRRPQDGSFRVAINKEGFYSKIDFRISIIPAYYGENVVLRILDSRRAPKSIDELGFSPRINESLHKLLKRNTGIILVTGPTGSGKSTTLYGSLMSAYRPGIKILTAEDPIEYVYDKVTQCEVNPSIGNTFANFIRAFLRQDPEIILVGEIRDSETAEMAFRAAQTGHLVLSTLHTNDAIGTVPRLLDLGIDPGLIGSCLVGVMSQRLIRRVCPECKREYKPSKDLVREFFQEPPSDIRWVSGQKCSQCNHTGYKGRLAVAELWVPSEKDLIYINKRTDADELRKSIHESGSTVSMAEDAMVKLREEKTNLEELIRTLPFSNIYYFRRLQEIRSPREDG